MARDHLLVIDQGTTSTRAVLYNARLQPAGQGQTEVLPSYPRSGWVEHDADALIASVGSQVTPALLDAGVKADRIAADGLTNQRETTIVWERATGRPIAPALVWHDRRTAAICVGCTASGIGSPAVPAWSLIRTSRRPRSPGSSITSPRLPASSSGRAGRGDRRYPGDLALDRRQAASHGCHVTRREPYSWTWKRDSIPTHSVKHSRFPPDYYHRFAPAREILASLAGWTIFPTAFRSPEWPAISRRRSLGKAALSRAMPSAPMAREHFCWPTPVPGSSARLRD